MNIKFKELCVKPIINKANKQINISLPKKQINKETYERILKGGSIKISLEDFE